MGAAATIFSTTSTALSRLGTPCSTMAISFGTLSRSLRTMTHRTAFGDRRNTITIGRGGGNVLRNVVNRNVAF